MKHGSENKKREKNEEQGNNKDAQRKEEEKQTCSFVDGLYPPCRCLFSILLIKWDSNNEHGNT